MNETPNSPAQPTTEILLASWGERFVAWLIDFIIVNTVLWAIFEAIAIPFWITGAPGSSFDWGQGPIGWAATSLVLFAYWIYFETATGQSLGKIALKIKTTDLTGNKIDVKNAAIESFGKAFLLPIDVILGWVFTNDKRQRIFSRAANTIVIKVKPAVSEGNFRYTKS